MILAPIVLGAVLVAASPAVAGVTFGIHTPQENATFDQLVAAWREAERLGFDQAWAYDHFAPIMGKTPVEGFYLDAGWGTWGFKATPVCGKRLAETIATGKPPKLIEPFALDRFANFVQIGERGAASVGH